MEDAVAARAVGADASGGAVVLDVGTPLEFELGNGTNDVAGAD